MKQDTTNKNAAMNTISGVGSGAVAGATIGSVVPGVGTLIGAGVGALIGGTAGFFSGKRTAEKDVKSLAIGPGMKYAGYMDQDVGKDYSFYDKKIGGEATGLAKAGVITQGVLTMAGQVAGGVKGASGGANLPSLKLGPSSVQNKLYKLDPLQSSSSIIGEQNLPEINIDTDSMWKDRLQNTDQSLYTNPFKNTII